MTAPAALTEALAHVARCRDTLTKAPGRDEPCERAMMALLGISVALIGLQHVAADIEDLSDGLEAAVDRLHDLASDVTGKAMKRMEQPAFDPHADWQKHEPRAAA